MDIKLANQHINVPSKYLVLVNGDYPIPDDYINNTRLVSVIDHSGASFLLEECTAKAYSELQFFLGKKGIYIDVCSAFRTIEEQKELFDNVAKDKGAEYAKKYVATPGHSEHHTGLAVDLSVFDGTEWIDDENSLKERAIFESISQYFHLFGFIIRYPKGKEEKTKTTYEPWHIRYVSRDAAAFIYNDGRTYCMEDFL